MKFVIIFLTLVLFFAVTPAFASSDSFPDNDIPKYQFVDFSYHNYLGESLTFVLEKTAKNQCNAFFAEISDEDNIVVWSEHRISSCVMANPELQTSQIKLGFKPHNEITLTDYGKYFLKIQIDDTTIETEFLLRPKSSGLSFDRTSAVPCMAESPLKQFKSGIPINEIQCKYGLQKMSKHDGTPSCVNLLTAPKMAERGWAWVLDLELWEENYHLIPAIDYEIRTATVSHGSQYMISGAIINDISYDEHTNSLKILVNSPEDGILQIVVPSGLLHLPGQSPLSYSVLADGEEIEYEKLSPILLKIFFDNGTEELEIIGVYWP